MQFEHLLSLFVAGKSKFFPRENAPLTLALERAGPYIRPNLRKEVFDTEKPSVILISAAGAAGKSALAQVLAFTGGLPLLNLSTHKAVGDNTISGLLTNSFLPADVGGVIGGLHSGTFGIVIDGLDEGRSKTTQQGFDAFLDDVASLCGASDRPAFVLLGRTAVLESCWLYLESKGVRTGLLSIEPFDRAQANDYIDQVSDVQDISNITQYEAARDAILEGLSGAFTDSGDAVTEGSFLSFIGYPPVLDAVATVLKRERNFHKLRADILSATGGDRAVDMLARISTLVLQREQHEKVWPNVLRGLCTKVDPHVVESIQQDGFSVTEQSVRLLAHCLDSPLDMRLFNDAVLDAQFEEQIADFFPDHPFLTAKRFRNAVFEAFSLAVAFMSGDRGFQELAMAYVDRFRPTYHLVYMCSKMAGDRAFPLEFIRALIGGSLDFRSRNSDVELSIEGFDAVKSDVGLLRGISARVDISASLDRGDVNPESLSSSFLFECDAADAGPINLGSTLANAFVYLPCDLILSSTTELKLVAPVAVFCAALSLDSGSLSATAGSDGAESGVLIDADRLVSSLRSVNVVGCSLEVSLEDALGVGYPMVEYLKKIKGKYGDPHLKTKHLRLRKLLTHFKSHSKGRLAKYADKVENERVAGNEAGAAVLQKLVDDGVLYKEKVFYFVDPGKLHEFLGVSWTDLRNGAVNPKLLAYLEKIVV